LLNDVGKCISCTAIGDSMEATMAHENLADDLLRGVKAISEYSGL